MKNIFTRWTNLLLVPIAFLFVGADNDLVNFTIYNNSGYSIYYVYISSSSSDSWGDDRLGEGEVLSNGESFTTLLYPSTYDLKLVDEDDDECINRGIDINRDVDWRISNEEWLDCTGYGSASGSSSSSSTTTVGRGSLSFTITNNSQWSVYYLRMSKSSSSEWGDDLLGDEVLSSGESIVIKVNPGTYDIKMEDEDGDECIQMGFKINNSTSWSYGDDEWLDCVID